MPPAGCRTTASEEGRSQSRREACMHVARAARPCKVTCFKRHTVCPGGGSQAVCKWHPGQTSPISRPDLAHLLAGLRPSPGRTSPLSQPDLAHLPARPLSPPGQTSHSLTSPHGWRVELCPAPHASGRPVRRTWSQSSFHTRIP